MKIFAEISPGELIDKITILEIKLERIRDEGKRANVQREYRALTARLTQAVPRSPALAELREALKAVNLALWEIEDEIRDQEREADFGDRFIALARAVYRTNDRRADIKREINLVTQSEMIEEKSYAAY
jgi:predicted  nucleic acid-binding Zn-ribbon protein